MKTLEQLGISPAPWKYIGYHYHKNGEYIHVGEVRVKCGKRKVVVDIAQPDARLIAAAPELYESLRECLEVLDRLNRYYRGVDAATYKTMAKARAAIEKSGGLK